VSTRNTIIVDELLLGDDLISDAGRVFQDDAINSGAIFADYVIPRVALEADSRAISYFDTLANLIASAELLGSIGYSEDVDDFYLRKAGGWVLLNVSGGGGGGGTGFDTLNGVSNIGGEVTIISSDGSLNIVGNDVANTIDISITSLDGGSF
jgi:hypothetical protein